jgi:hypothetical protein
MCRVIWLDKVINPLGIALAALLPLATLSCDRAAAPADAGPDAAPGHPDAGELPRLKTVPPSPETQQLLGRISGYRTWMKFPENLTPKLSAQHGNMYVVAYHNDIVKQAMERKLLPLPDGALIVKDNLAMPSDAMPMVITVMSKQSEKWYWLEATPEGQVVVDEMVDKGKPLEGFGVAMCTGCHGARKDTNDYIFTHDFGP